MVKHSLRSLLTHRLRLLLTVVAVTVGVAFVAGTFVLSDTMGKAFDQLYAGLNKGIDVSVKARPAYNDVHTQGQTRPIKEQYVDQVASVPGVAVAEGSVTGFALILDKRGEPLQPGGAPTLGASIHTDRRLGGQFTFRSGHAPSGPHEVVLDAASATKAGYSLGDTVPVVFQDGRQSFELVGIAGFGDSDNLAGATLAGFDMPTAQKVLDRTGKVDTIDVVGDPSVSPEELRDRIAAALPSDLEAQTGTQVAAEGSQAVRDGLGIFTTILLVFAGVSLVVGSFVIWNTFNVLVAQRRRETALLRAVGATRRQILGGIVLEALVVGLVSSGLGLLAGVGLAVGIRSLLAAVGIEVPTTSAAVETRTIVAALVVGVGVTLVAAVWPALGATRVAPVEALREATPSGHSIGRVRRVLGWSLLGLGLLGLVASAVVGDQAALTGLFTIVAFVGLVIAGPLLARAVAAIADRGRRGNGWRLAARNVRRSPQRAAATALALTIGLTVVSAVAVTAASTKASVADVVSGGNRSDLIIKAASQTSAGISPAVASILRAQDGVRTVAEMRYTSVRVDGRSTMAAGAPTSDLEDVADLGIRSGSLDDFDRGSVLLGTKAAETLGVSAGDSVTVTFPETGEQTLRVAGTFQRDALVGSQYIVAMPDFEANVTSKLDMAVLVRFADGVSAASERSRVEKALADYPNVKVQDASDLTEDAQANVDQMLGLVTALLALAVVVAVLGIVNTLALSVVERTRELGLLRAVGATRRQVRTVVRRESVLISMLGAVAGVLVGTVAGVALSRSLVDSGVSSVSVPVGTLVVYLVVAALVGVLAAVGPARRASKVDVLRAVTTE